MTSKSAPSRAYNLLTMSRLVKVFSRGGRSSSGIDLKGGVKPISMSGVGRLRMIHYPEML